MNTRALVTPILIGVDIHGLLHLLSRPRYLHLWADGSPAGGLAVQQCHPETELVLRSAGPWLKGQGTKEEDVVCSEKSQRNGTSPTSWVILLQQFLAHINKNHFVSDNCCKSRVLYLAFYLRPSVGYIALMSHEECSYAFPTSNSKLGSGTQNI